MAITVLTAENFEKEVLESEVPVLIDFWATWCGPCSMMSPVVDEIAEEYKGIYKVCKVNVDEQSELAEQFEVQFIPTFFVLKNAEVTAQRTGVFSKGEMLELLEK